MSFWSFVVVYVAVGGMATVFLGVTLAPAERWKWLSHLWAYSMLLASIGFLLLYWVAMSAAG
ncbi:MAG: hypothetical protein HZC36_01315 [Armatimonadetes bacterium]|nr:hypothetical protein [Armatimonadota bacterium]